MKTQFVADDNTVFSSAEECLAYEAGIGAKQRVESFKEAILNAARQQLPEGRSKIGYADVIDALVADPVRLHYLVGGLRKDSLLPVIQDINATFAISLDKLFGEGLLSAMEVENIKLALNGKLFDLAGILPEVQATPADREVLPHSAEA